MNKLLWGFLTFLLPALALADNGGSSISFAPPATDFSVVFLSNIFGVVDGVLHGSGSQIMGAMFGVFNAAVLTLGGIVIMYTLIVSTLNTAHKGQMMGGEKWSSMWVPFRATAGLALLIPKASGYCLMQIFVMWLVVQGVGAADKVWDAALSYLNRGGVIVQAEPNPASGLTNTTVPGIYSGAMTMLSGQVCMIGLQKQLEALRQDYMQAKTQNSGPCAGDPTGAMKTLCGTSVPDFVGTVSAVSVQSNYPTASSFNAPMPNFDSNSPYAFLNGICGNIQWSAYDASALSKIQSTYTQQNQQGGGSSSQLSPSEIQTIKMSRAIAIQQAYMDLTAVAKAMVDNDPQITTNPGGFSNLSQSNYSAVATDQFGVPFTVNGQSCNVSSDGCVTWGQDSTNGGAPLFNGTEFLGAISDYNNVMKPTLNLYSQAVNNEQAAAARDFINGAQAAGWSMAGAYYFNLVQLNGMATASTEQDTGSGLENSSFDPANLTSAFGQNNTCTGPYADLCTWFGQNPSSVAQIVTLINGNGMLSSPLAPPGLKTQQTTPRNLISGIGSSTVYGLVNNSVMMTLPNQPGLNPSFTFPNLIHTNIDTSVYTLQQQNFDCGKVKILYFSFCLGEMLGDIFFNYIFLYVYNFFMNIMGQAINNLVITFLMVPLQGMAAIFQQGVQTLATPGVNPIVALANMGTMYINFSANLWIMLLDMAITTALIPIIGVAIFALIAMAMPLLLAWIGTMVTIGFSTAYYVPLLPYMIFTFGVLAWLMAVIEAMVAAPIVALGVTHPEGHEAFGKGEPALLILVNVFLRPAMMIIGYVAAIILSYVGIWLVNAGFQIAITFMQPGSSNNSLSYWQGLSTPGIPQFITNASGSRGSYGSTGNSISYSEWAGIYAFFFSILAYTTLYLIIVQRSFTLIHLLPDKVLRWIGGQPEAYGQETAQWGEEARGIAREAGKGTQEAQAQTDKQLSGYAQKALTKAKDAAGKFIQGEGGEGGGKGVS